MRLTRKQLQDDLAAAKKREEILARENDRYRQNESLSTSVIKQLTDDVNDWRSAFKILCKLVNRT